MFVCCSETRASWLSLDFANEMPVRCLDRPGSVARSRLCPCNYQRKERSLVRGKAQSGAYITSTPRRYRIVSYRITSYLSCHIGSVHNAKPRTNCPASRLRQVRKPATSRVSVQNLHSTELRFDIYFGNALVAGNPLFQVSKSNAGWCGRGFCTGVE